MKENEKSIAAVSVIALCAIVFTCVSFLPSMTPNKSDIHKTIIVSMGQDAWGTGIRYNTEKYYKASINSFPTHTMLKLYTDENTIKKILLLPLYDGLDIENLQGE